MRCTEVRPAGTQLWHKNTLGGGGTKAAYCSTLAVYIYDVAETPKLEKILTGPDKTICSIAWSPTDPNTLAMEPPRCTGAAAAAPATSGTLVGW